MEVIKVAVSDDRRKFERSTYETAVALESLDAGTSVVATMFNYSKEGLYFETDSFITPGKEIFIGIAKSPYSQGTSKYECHRVQVKWIKELYESSYRYGYGVKHHDPIECYQANIIITGNDEQNSDSERQKTEAIKTAQGLRKHPRKTFSRPVYFSTQNRYYQGRIKDISRGGMYVKTKDEFAIGQVLHLVIPETKYDKNVLIRGEVVRSSKSGVGVKFTGLLKRRKPSKK
jgi:Tfp pilus assembly protein PilZ